MQILSSDSILSRFIRSGSILAIGSMTENIFRFLRNMILARLLAPEAFGLMATVIAVVAAVEAFAEVGLKQSVIQNKNGADEKFLNIIWWLASMRGLLLFSTAYLLAPTLCTFYNKPEALQILRTGFLVILFNGLISPKVHVLEKEMSFRKWVFLMQGSGLLGVLTAVVSAFYLFNVWALVLGLLTEAFLRTSLSFIFCPIKIRFTFDHTYFQEILRFSRRMFGLPILMMIFGQADVFIIGKVLSFELLGIYALARGLAEMPNAFISRIIQPVVLPTLSQMQDDTVRLKSTLLKITELNATFGLPFISFLVVFSETILSIVYGPQYAVVSKPFSILCLSNLILLSSSFIMNVFIAKGQPNIHRVASLCRTTFFMIIIYPATAFFGLYGASSSMLAAMCLSLGIQLLYLKKLLNINLYEYCKRWFTGLKLSLIVILPGFFIITLIDSNILTTMIIGIVFCIIAWGIGIYNLRIFQKLKFSP